MQFNTTGEKRSNSTITMKSHISLRQALLSSKNSSLDLVVLCKILYELTGVYQAPLIIMKVVTFLNFTNDCHCKINFKIEFYSQKCS